MNKMEKFSFFFYIAIFALAIGIRIYDVQDPPLDFHPTRQLHSTLIARGMYASLDEGKTFSEGQKDIAINQWKLEGLIEPPIMEWLSAIGYLLMGKIELWFPRLIAIVFWIVAGLGIFLTSELQLNSRSIFLALSLFFLYPYAVIASRSFQPESLLVASISLFLYSVIRWHQVKSWKWTLIAGIMGGIAIFIKTVAIFFIVGIWAAVILSGRKKFAILRNLKVWAAAIVTILPYMGFHIYGVYIANSLSGQFSLRFFPQLWLQISFYINWLYSLREVFTIEILTIAVLGIVLTKKNLYRNVLLGMWVGYVFLGFTLPYHTSTHNYYHLPLFIPVSLGVGLFFDRFLEFYKQRIGWASNLAGLMIIFLFSIYTFDTVNILRKIDYRYEVDFWESLGERFDTNSVVAALSQDYGYRLAYWGWKTPINWPSTNDINLREIAGQQIELRNTFDEIANRADYFLITDFVELEKQPFLLDWLYEQYSLVEKGERFLLFAAN